MATKEELLKLWQQGWACVFNTLNNLTTEDLTKEVTIRRQPHSVIDAIIRQIDHYGYHIGQILQLGKQIKDDKWIALSIAVDEKKNFNP